jgi:solute:Na+ symporter, SSS family
MNEIESRWWLIGFIGLYLIINLLIGWWAARRVKTSQDFAVAGRQLSLPIASCTLFATWFGSETVLGSTAEFVQHGILGVIKDPFGSSLCLVLVGAFFTRKFYRMNLLTFNDYFNLRYSRNVELVSAIFMVPSYFGWVAGQLVAMAIILQVLLGIPLYVGIAICAIVVVIYTYTGGMWAVSLTDFVQTIFIILGMIVLTVEVVNQVGGVNKILNATPPEYFRFYPKPKLEDILHYIVAWITVGLGSIPQQDIFQRATSAKTERIAVMSAYIGAIMYLVIATLPLLVSLGGRILHPELLKGDTQMLLPQMVLNHSSLFLKVMFFGALLSAILSTTSGAMLAPAVVVGENIIRPYYPNMTDAQMLRIMRLSVIGVAVCSAVLANMQGNIYELAAQSSTLSLVSLFIPLWAGMYWRRASTVGAMASILGGMTVWAIFEFAGHWFPSSLAGLLASFLGMLLGSLIFPDSLARQEAIKINTADSLGIK